MRARASIAVAALLVVAQVLAAAAAPAAAASPTWSAVRLSDNRADRWPCVATDSLGITYVAFQRVGHQPGVWVSTNRSGSWRTTRLTTGPTDSCGGLSIDPKRHLHILVFRIDQLLYLTNRTGAWRVRVVAETANFPSLIVDRNGRVAIAYRDPSGIAVASNRSGAWRTSHPVHGFVGAMSRLAADGVGHFWLAYQTAAGVFVATNRTGSWRIRRIDRVGGGRVDLGLDGAGHVYVAIDRSTRPVFLLSNRSGAWRTSHVYRTDASLRSLTVTSSGRIHLLLESEAGIITDHTNRSGAWRTLILARGADLGSALTLDRLGRMTMAWTLSGSVMLTSNRSGSFHTMRLTSASSDRLMAMTADAAGHRYVVLARTGVGAGLLLATDRSTSWAFELVSAADPDTAAIALDAAGHVHIAYTGDQGAGYAVEGAGGWLETSLPPISQVLLLTPDDPSGVRVIGMRGADVVTLRDDAGGWVVDTVASVLGSCQDAAVDATGVVRVACGDTSGVICITSAPGPWTSELAAPRTNPFAEMTAEAISVDGAGTVSIAFAEFIDDTGPDPADQKIASFAGGAWISESTGIVAFARSAFADLATDTSGHRRLLTSGSGLVETEDSTESWVSSTLPVGASPTLGRLTIDAAGVETVAAEVGAGRLAGAVDHPIDDGGIVILTR